METKLTLPEEFLDRMKELLQDECEEFVASYDRPRSYGLRRNPLKLDEEAFLRTVPFTLQKVPWAREGYYYDHEQRPGRHPLHEQGVYYIQEPSAMVPVQILDPKPGEIVLDLCAAPGGKTTMIAGRMQGEGLLIANEIVPGRAKILAQNVERMGITNAIVCNHSPQELAEHFCGFFDRIVVDAPCSGEGMFHKEEAALTEWSADNVAHCADRQREILPEAISMLAEGGRLVYSTCTFAPQENEQIVAWILAEYPQLEIEPIDAGAYGISPARPDWAGQYANNLSSARLSSISGAARIWPHRCDGEGHFVASFYKSGERRETFVRGLLFQKVTEYVSRSEKTDGKKTKNRKKGKDNADADAWKLFEEFALQYLTEIPVGKTVCFGDQIYLLPQDAPELKGLRVYRAGLHLGTVRSNRFEPSHALALALRPDQVKQTLDVSDVCRYLNGESVSSDSAQKGWLMVTYRGLPIGWGKASGGVVKNHYPKGLRRDLTGFFEGRDCKK